MKNKQLSILSLAGRLSLSAVLVSCVSTTTIRAVSIDEKVDREVKIYVDDKYLGKGEVSYSDSKNRFPLKTILEPVTVKLKKPGCLTFEKPLKTVMNNKKTLLTWLVLGLGTLVPLVMFPLSISENDDSDTIMNSTVGMVSVMAIAGIVAGALSLSIYEYKPLHSFEYPCATDATKIIQ